MSQLDSQEGRLDRIQAAIVALDVVVVLLGLTVLSQAADVLKEPGIVSHRCPRFAARAEVLARIETEAP